MKESFRIAQGDDVYLEICVVLDGVASPIGDAELYFTAKRNATDPDDAALFQLTRTNGGIVVSDPTTNIANANIPSSATAGAQLGRYVFDFRIKSTGFPDEVQTIASGEIFIEAAITQSTD